MGSRIIPDFLTVVVQAGGDDLFAVCLIVRPGGVVPPAAIGDRGAQVGANLLGHVEKISGDLPVIALDVLAADEQCQSERNLKPGQHEVTIEGVDVLGADENLLTVGVDLGPNFIRNRDQIFAGAEGRDHHVDRVNLGGPIAGGVRVDGR